MATAGETENERKKAVKAAEESLAAQLKETEKYLNGKQFQGSVKKNYDWLIGLHRSKRYCNFLDRQRVDATEAILKIARKNKAFRGEDEKPVDFALRIFEDLLKANGYKGIGKEFIPVVTLFGNDNQKIALILCGYYDAEPKLLTPSQREAIEESLYATPQGDALFSHLIAAFNAIGKQRDRLYRFYFEYTAEAINAAFHFSQRRRVQELNQIKEALKDNSDFAALNIGIPQMAMAEHHLNRAKQSAERAERDIILLKSLFTALDRFVSTNKAELIVPYEWKEASRVTKDFVPQLGARYYKDHLESLKFVGADITEEDREVAIFPSYDDVEAEEEMVQGFLQRMITAYKSYMK